MLQNGEIHSLCRSPNVVRVINSRRLRWIDRVARIEKDRNPRINLKEICINTRNWVDSARNGN